MRYQLLRWILEQEGSDFQSVANRWKPTRLLYLQQVRNLLRDMEQRLDRLEAALEELRTLDRADRYVKALVRMRLYLRKAKFTWKGDQMVFFQSSAGFYQEYGAILYLLKVEDQRGRLADPAEGVKEGV